MGRLQTFPKWGPVSTWEAPNWPGDLFLHSYHDATWLNRSDLVDIFGVIAPAGVL
jgi:hypothetical protein